MNRIATLSLTITAIACASITSAQTTVITRGDGSKTTIATDSQGTTVRNNDGSSGTTSGSSKDHSDVIREQRRVDDRSISSDAVGPRYNIELGRQSGEIDGRREHPTNPKIDLMLKKCFEGGGTCNAAELKALGEAIMADYIRYKNSFNPKANVLPGNELKLLNIPKQRIPSILPRDGLSTPKLGGEGRIND